MNRRPLGRGLDALIQSTTREGNGVSDLTAESLRRLADPTADLESIRRLADSPDPRPKGKGGESGMEKEAGSDAAGLQLIALERIVPGRFQPRQYFGEAAVAELAEAI